MTSILTAPAGQNNNPCTSSSNVRRRNSLSSGVRAGRPASERPNWLLSAGLTATYRKLQAQAAAQQGPAAAAPPQQSASRRSSILFGLSPQQAGAPRLLTEPGTIVEREEDGILFKNDNENADLVVSTGMTLDGRFEALQALGSGGFGQVYMCRDLKGGLTDDNFVAVKIIKSGPNFDAWAEFEMRTLQKLEVMKSDPRSVHFVQYYGAFSSHQHRCMIFEPLKMSLFDVMVSRDYKGLPFKRIREVARQLLTALSCTAAHRIIHADIKPENIMLTEGPNNRWDVRLIDFGTSCSVDDDLYDYIQSRYYRAPEVIVGASYGTGIDVWAAGTTIAEMFMGVPLLGGTSEFEQLHCMEEMFGQPLPDVILKGSAKVKQYYNVYTVEDGTVVYCLKSRREYYGDQEIPEQPKCFRYSDFANLMSHRPFTVEDIQSAFLALTDGQAERQHAIRQVLDTGSVKCGLGHVVPNSYLSPSPSATALHEQTIIGVPGEAPADTKQVIHLIEFERWLLADLIERLLEFDPKKRISAESALKHQFFTYFDGVA